MNLSAQFKEYLFSQSNPPSRITVKNYLSDINKFIRWIEAKLGYEFNPTDINQNLIDSFKEDSLKSYSASSVDRSLSSLRKFFYFLKLEGKISQTPFEVSTVKSEAPDPWRLKEFKNHLYVFGASHLTIKNYIIDVKQFLTWADEVVKTDETWEISKSSNFSKITSGLIEEYKNRLLNEAHLSPISVNRKLSSIRRFISWANEEGLIKDNAEVVNLPSNTSGFKTNPSDALAAAVAMESISSEVTPANNGYSAFPPLRVYQKTKDAGIAAFDTAVTAPLADVLDKSDEVIWNLKGHPVFKDRLKASFKIPSLKMIDPKKINNVPKSFYAPAFISTANFPLHRKVIHHARHSRPKWYKTYHSYAFASYLHFSILMLFISAMGYMVFNDFNTKQQAPILAALPSAPPRILSFQGRLTDANDNPITKGTTLRMAIYNNQTASGSALLWQETVSPTPDEEGIFSILLGNNNPIPQSLFAQNSGLWLGITVEKTQELKPRQQIATVAFAANAETLQGLPPITNTTATSNVVLALNSSGNLTIGGTANPTFQATGGTFTVSGRTLVLTTSSNGNIRLAPNGTGIIDIQKSIQNTSNSGIQVPGSVTIEDLFSVIATSSGNAVMSISQGSTGDLIIASTSGNIRFKVDNAGNITANGSFNGLAMTSGTVTSGTWQGTAIGAPYGGTGQTSYSTGDMLYASDSTVISKLSIGSNGTCLTSNGTTPSWVSCLTASGGSGYWNQSAGILFPNNATVDLLVGGQSTASAKFAVLNVNGTGPATATVSGNLIVMPTNGEGGNLGIGITNPEARIHTTSSNGNNVSEIHDYYSDTLNGPGIVFRKARGTFESPTASLLGDNLGNIGGRGYGTTGFSSFTKANIAFIAEENWTDSAQGAYISFLTTATGGTTRTEKLRITGSGNVGIGTTSPTAKLDVAGDASIGGQFTFRSGSGQIQTTQNQNLTIGGNSTGNIILSPLNGSGNVGIGTSAPDSTLTLSKSTTETAPTGILRGTYTYNPSSGPGSTSVFPYIVTNVVGGSQDLSGVVDYGIYINTSVNSTSTGANALGRIHGAFMDLSNSNTGTVSNLWGYSVRIINSSTGTISSAKGIDIFGLTNGGGGTITNTYGLYIGDLTAGTQTNTPFSIYSSDAGTINYFAGNTGIGTTSPTATLDVAGTASLGGQLTFRSGTAQIQSTAGQTLTLGGSATGIIQVNNKSNSPFTTFDTINSRIGIGVSNPNYIIDASQNINDAALFSLENTNAGANAYAASNFENGTGYAQFGIAGTGYSDSSGLFTNRAYVYANSNTDGLVIYTSGSTDPIVFATDDTETGRFTATGLFGVGTTSPIAQLHVSRNLGVWGATGKALAIFDQIENQDIFTASASGTTRLQLSGSGRLTLSTPNDSYGFTHTNGTTTLNSYIDTSKAYIGTDTDSDFQIYVNGGVGVFNVESSTTPGSNGLVSIGAFVEPISQLHVSRPLSQGVTGKSLVILDQYEDQDILVGSSSGALSFAFKEWGQLDLNTNTAGGWSRGLHLTRNNGTTSTGYFGGFGLGDTVNYLFIAGNEDDWDDPIIAFTPTGNVGVGTEQGLLPSSALYVTRNLGRYAATGKALVIFDQTENQDIFTASASGVTKFVVDSSGNTYVGALSVASLTGVCWQNSTLNGATMKQLTDCSGAPTSDYAERYPVEEGIQHGELVALGEEDVMTYGAAANGSTDWNKELGTTKRLVRTSTPYQVNLMGITSDNYGDFTSTGNNIKEEDNPMSVALNGRVLLKVSIENGPINAGDMITSSSIPGVGMKATKPGRVVGMAVSSYSNDGVGDVMVFVNIHHYDPDVQLADAGTLTLAPTVDDNFEVKRQSGETVNRIGAYSEILVAKLKAGYLETGKLIVTGSASVKNLTTETLASTIGNFSQLSTDSLVIGSENINIAGQSLREYIASIVEDVVGESENEDTIIVSPILATDIITPKTGKTLTVKLNSDDSSSTFEIQNLSGSTVASIDALGNASLSGELRSESIQTGDATVSGTLRADKIIANQIEGLNIQASSVSANYITNNYYQATPSASYNQATGSASFDNLVAMRATFEQGLMAFGPASFYEASVADRLFVGSKLSLADTSINVLGGNLELQPLRQGGVSLVGGLVEIDVDGNLKVNGNAYFAKDVDIKGKLLASFVSPLPGRDFVLELGKRDEDGESENHNSSFVIRNSSASALLSVNNQGDLNASGAGTFNKLNLNIVNKALALSPTEVIATGSAGTAEIQPNREELTIRNSLVTENSLIYITTKTSTQNESVYLLRQVPGKSFTVGISNPINKKIPFNWIIIN